MLQSENNQEVLNENSGRNKNVGEVEHNKDDQIAMETYKSNSKPQEDSNGEPQHTNQNEVSHEGLQRQSAKQKINKSSRYTINQTAERIALRLSVNPDMANEDVYEAVGVDEMQPVKQNGAELPEEAPGSPTVSDHESDVDTEILQDPENEGEMSGIVNDGSDFQK